MNDVLTRTTLSKTVVDREIYLAVAAISRPAVDVLAGIVRHLVLVRPDADGAELARSSDVVAAAIAQHRPDPTRDLSPNGAFQMCRILAAVVPRLTEKPLRTAAASYSRAFLRSFRRGTTQLRQVQPLELQFDRARDVDRFRREIWEDLYDTSGQRRDVAQAVDTGPLGSVLGIATSDAASTIVAKTDLPALQTFIAGHLQHNGTLAVPVGGVQPALAGLAATVSDLRDEYTLNLININVSISKAEKGETPENSTGLAAAIARAEAKQKELDELLKEAVNGTQSTLGVLAALADLGDEEFGSDIREFAAISVGMLHAVRQAAEASIQVGKVINRIASASASMLLLGGGIGFAFVMMALMIQSVGLFGGRSKSIEEVILEELHRLAKSIAELREEMHERFDRIDQRLDRMYVGILTRLAEIDFNLGQVDGNVTELQASLYQLHTELGRLCASLQSQLDAAHRRDLVQGINGFLEFRERTGQQIDAPTFFAAENLFFSWGHDHAKDALQAGPEDRRFTDDDLLTELTRFTTATNVNYLREVPAGRFGLSPLSQSRLANPLDWIVAAEAYAQLNEESAGLAAEVADARVDDLIEIGESLGRALGAIADPRLITALAEHYRDRLRDVRQVIDAAETEFRVAPRHQLEGIILSGGPEQQPTQHFFTSDRWAELSRCDGGSFNGNTARLPSSALTDFELGELAPYLIADNLRDSTLPGVAQGLSRLSACISASWRLTKTEEPGLGSLVFMTFSLSIQVTVRYGSEAVYRYTANTPSAFRTSVPKREVPSFDPTRSPRGKDPYPLLVGDEKLWLRISTFQRRQHIVNPTLRAATAKLVENKLQLAQRAFYAQVAERFVQAGAAIERLGQRLSGSKLLWQNLIQAGLPLSLHANEVLRSLLFGGNALLGGADTEEEGTFLDDMRTYYAWFANRTEDTPAFNVAANLEALASERLRRLETLVKEIIAAGDPPEPPQLFAPTLLRLHLLN